MVSVEKNMSFLKQSDGTMWNFSYDKSLGIIYKIYKENKWSDYNLLTSKTKGKYSVTLLQNDTICIVYENLAGEVIMKLYTNDKWTRYYIITNNDKGKIDINFKTIVYENHLFIFFSVYNKDTNLVTIYSNLIDEEGNLSSPLLIDEITFENNVIFSIYPSNKESIYIIYQKKESNYILGYKVFNRNSKGWSNFNKIDESLFQFKDYYLLFYKDYFHSIYTKIDNNKIYSLNYCKGNLSSNKYITISRHKNITSSSLFIAGDHIWCFWIRYNEIFSTVSIDGGETFSKPNQDYLINSLSLYKASYISNFSENNHIVCMGEIFAENIDSPNILLVDDIYGLINKQTENAFYSFDLQYFISSFKVSNKISNINFLEKDLLIKEQNDIIDNQKNKLISYENKLMSYENKFNSISNLIRSFNENSFQLNEGISLLQDNLEEKGKELNELKKMFTEKEIELELLKNELKNTKLKKNSTFHIKKVLAKLFSNPKA